MRFAFQPVVLEGEEGNLTLFTIVREKSLVEKAILATENIVGDLDDPNTGVLAAWPLSYVKGLPPLSLAEDGEERELMVWVKFLVSSLIIVLAAIKTCGIW